MATMDYIEIPEGATRLRGMSDQQHQRDDEKQHHDVRPAAKITTSIPNPSPPHSPTPRTRRQSLLSTTANSLNSPTSAMSFIPQMLLSAALPPVSPGSPTSTTPTLPNLKRTGLPESYTLMSTKDPLSLPIMSTNFKRFVTIIGPVFWLQDRIEEIILWKRGTLRTAVWMAAYAFILLIGVILATYPYPASASADPLYSSSDANSASPPSTSPPMEGIVPWQANIQGIQNLMGAVADLHALVEPHVYHLILTPQHLAKSTPKSTAQSTQDSSTGTTTSQFPRSPYTTHILTLLVVTLPPLLLLIHLPIFPIREVCLFGGLAPFVLTHPYVRLLIPLLWGMAMDTMPVLLARWRRVRNRITAKGRRNGGGDETKDAVPEKMLPLSMIVQRIIDDDRLTDECWNSEMREVQLWENERYGDSSILLGASSSSSSSSMFLPPQKGWSKLNLRPGERGAWTRGQDGWSGSGGGGSANADGGTVEVGVGGEVSSNLTFSLAPGWRFVETEDWRKDLKCEWSGCGGDPDGWVYTNDAWLGSRPAPYTSGGGSVTRRRRWVRRVWFDWKKAKEDS
ncbi:hypothetical protein JR316_0007465 [Psilocybe cubensis]|uniref:Uncharacterized protein n=1 Tax=Psilocybe cubensis TaxID=181762 RepID=A0ACB8GYZ9_PSICU|nr:hypothetical protein JR316_0007465 [Psilocybe cubensis]KAH9480863.1 hypothetical protein JR316_0007465 [Psilocybe cubensis]